MPPEDTQESSPDSHDGQLQIPCNRCQSAVQSPGREAITFLLIDQLRIPLAGCREHLEQFRSICDLTTEATAELLEFRPAGGISCQPCRLSAHNSSQPLMPVSDGAVLVLACPTHQSQVVDRFQTGLETRQQLTASLDPLET